MYAKPYTRVNNPTTVLHDAELLPLNIKDFKGSIFLSYCSKQNKQITEFVTLAIKMSLKNVLTRNIYTVYGNKEEYKNIYI
jgi:hypothetical protein